MDRQVSTRRGRAPRTPDRRLVVVLFAALVLALGSTGSHAQEDDGSAIWQGVEQMVVTGSGAAGILEDTAVSVTAFDASELEAMGIGDVADIGQFTPNLEIRTAGSTTPILFIRGVGLNDFTANASGSVAVYQDDVALNLPAFQSAQLFDTDAVQVLKGPQGSGPGRNASAGAIRVTSRRPSGDFGGYLNVGVGNFGLVQADGALEAPIVPDLLAIRLAFQFEKRDGLVHNRCGGFTVSQVAAARRGICGEVGGAEIRPGLEEDLNNVNRWAARGVIRFQPEWLDSQWVLNIHGSRIDQLATVGQPIGTAGNAFADITRNGYIIREIQAERQLVEREAIRAARRNPNITNPREQGLANAKQTLANRLAFNRPLDWSPFEGDYNLDGHERQETWGASLRGDMEIGRISFSTITGFEHYDRSRIIDADYTSSIIFEFDIQDDAWQVTQDFRFEQELESLPLSWKAGGYALAERLDYDQFTFGDGDIPGILQRYAQATWAFGIYGEFDYKLTDDLEFKAGIRYNWERKSFDIEEITSPISNTVDLNRCNERENIPAADCDDRRTFSDPTGVVRFTYHFDDSTEIYAKYTRGWKGLQYNASDGTVRGAFTLAKPETIDSIEIGGSGSWFDGRLALSTAFFFYRYENYQVFLFANDLNSPPIRVVRNASAAQIYGAELDATIEPIESLQIVARFGWLESKFLDFASDGIREIVTGGLPNLRRLITEVPIDYTGNRLPNTPRFKFSGSIQYTFDLRRLGTLTPRYDITFTDDFSFDPSKQGRGAPDNFGNFFLPKFAIGQRAYTLHNARLTYRAPNDQIEVALWVRNLSNLVYKTLAFDASATGGLVGNQVGDPRTYGATVKFTF